MQHVSEDGGGDGDGVDVGDNVGEEKGKGESKSGDHEGEGEGEAEGGVEGAYGSNDDELKPAPVAEKSEQQRALDDAMAIRLCLNLIYRAHSSHLRG